MNRVAQSAGIEAKAFGTVTMALGLLAVLAPLVEDVSIALLVGILVLAAGIVRMFWASRARNLGGGPHALAIGLVTLLCGAVMLANPLFAAGVLESLLAGYLLFDGALEVSAALRLRRREGRAGLLSGGVLSLVLGVSLCLQAPLADAWAIGVLLGCKILSIGWIMTSAGRTFRAAPIPSPAA